MTNIQKDIEAILGECVGEERNIKETARKVLEKVREEWGSYGNGCGCCESSSVKDEIDEMLASLAREDKGDNGRDND